MVYINSFGIVRMCEQESADVYRSSAGALPTIVYSGIDISHIMPLEGTIDIEVDYDNYKTFEIKQAFTLFSGVLSGDELHIGSDIWGVRVVENWKTPNYWHLIVEEVK